GSSGKIQRLIDHMDGPALDARGIEQTGGPLTHDARSKSSYALRAGEVRDQRGLRETLEINREVIMLAPELIFSTPPGARVVTPEDDNPIDKAVTLEQWNPAGLHHPRHARVGKAVFEGRSSRQGVNNVAHCAEANNQNTLHRNRQLRSLTNIIV